MAVPKKFLAPVDLHAGSEVRISVEQGQLIVEPKIQPHYTLSELLAKTRRSDLVPKRKDRLWRSGNPIGKEIL